jgi:hypothetical protein
MRAPGYVSPGGGAAQIEEIHDMLENEKNLLQVYNEIKKLEKMREGALHEARYTPHETHTHHRTRTTAHAHAHIEGVSG